MAKKYTVDELNHIKEQFEELILDQTTYYLIVDKQVTSRRGVLNALSGAGIDSELLLEASDGLDATAHAGRHEARFVVIMEAKLPDMKGEDLIARIRKKKGHEKDEIVVYTAESKKQVLAPVLAAGVKGYLKKPLGANELLEELRELGVLDI